MHELSSPPPTLSGSAQASIALASDVPHLPGRVRPGDRKTSDELLTLVYEELRGLADRLLSAQGPCQTLQPTALVHEAYLRLAGTADAGWENRAHFFGAAARAIRRILIDRARARGTERRGGGRHPLPLEAAADVMVGEPPVDVLALDEAIERLTSLDARKARVVELRFFGGLTTEETAETLGISPSMVVREWRFARAWLHRELGDRDV